MLIDDVKRVQSAGWTVIAVDQQSTLAACPSHGCGLMVRIPHGQKPQSCDPGLNRGPRDVPIGSFEDLRRALRARRQELHLAIAEVEDTAGLTRDHLAKSEQEDAKRRPNVDTAIWWAQALGYELVLRPASLPDIAIRIISETRDQASRRRRPSRRQKDDSSSR